MPDIPGEKNTKDHTFIALDGLRGVAAISVAVYHCQHLLHVPEPNSLLPNAFAAVDFFFLLSGFVVAYAYETRLLAGESFFSFMRRRLIRLYPLYALGLTIPVVVLAINLLLQLPHENRTLAFIAYPLGLLLLPTPDFSQIHNHSHAIFPLDEPAWSLALEIAVNAIYALVCLKLSSKRLVAFSMLSALLLVVASYHFKGTDLGALWSSYLGGWARVLWSFPAGIALYRLYRARTLLSLPGWSAIFLAVLLVGIFAIPDRSLLFELAVTIGVFPFLLLWGASTPLSGPARRLSAILGTVSYAVYILHSPTINVLWLIFLWTGTNPESHPTLFLFSFLIATSIFAWACDAFYDAPVRRYLTRRFSHAPAGRGAPSSVAVSR